MIKDEELKVYENVSLKEYNTYKIDGRAKYLIEVLSVNSLLKLLSFLQKNNIKYMILGNGSNVIIDDYFDGAIIKLKLNDIEINDNIVTVGSGVMLPKLVRILLDKNLVGMEWAINIPGTVGGSIIGNAGAYNQEIFDDLIEIKAVNKNNEIMSIKKDDIKYEYRHTNLQDLGLIVIAATFKLEFGDTKVSKELIKDRCSRRMESQPLDMPSAGSVFRNPPGDHAGRLIEELGLKGKRIGDALVSQKHANFIVNVGNATSKDIKDLIKLVKKEVLKKYNIDLIVEQNILNWK